MIRCRRMTLLSTYLPYLSHSPSPSSKPFIHIGVHILVPLHFQLTRYLLNICFSSIRFLRFFSAGNSRPPLALVRFLGLSGEKANPPNIMDGDRLLSPLLPPDMVCIMLHWLQPRDLLSLALVNKKLQLFLLPPPSTALSPQIKELYRFLLLNGFKLAPSSSIARFQLNEVDWLASLKSLSVGKGEWVVPQYHQGETTAIPHVTTHEYAG